MAKKKDMTKKDMTKKEKMMVREMKKDAWVEQRNQKLNKEKS